MNKKILTLFTAAVFSAAAAIPSFAGTWQVGMDGDTAKWWYDNGDGTKAVSCWQWIDGNGDGIAECYCFDANGWMYASTVTPDNYTVNENGAWTVDGIVQTQSTATSPAQDQGSSSSGWQKIGSDWYYRTGGRFVTSEWKRISGKRYYFDENGVMATGFQEIDGNTYYFTSSGALKTKDFKLDGIRYTVEEDGVIVDQEDADDWDSFQDEESSSSGSSDNSSGSSGSSSGGSGPSSEVDTSPSYEKPTESYGSKQEPPDGYGADRYEEAVKNGEI